MIGTWAYNAMDCMAKVDDVHLTWSDAIVKKSSFA